MQKDVVLTCCRDEADIVETFVRFYLKMGFDEVYVVDNGSIDDTVNIVTNLIASGMPVHLKVDHRLGYERYLSEHYHWVGQIAAPRWLFFLDCDEFIFFPEGAKNYIAGLESTVNCLQLQQREMFPLISDNTDVGTEAQMLKGSFLLTTRTDPSFNDTTKDVTIYNPNARIYAGKHLIEYSTKNFVKPEDIFIRHYKYRSLDQARRKEKNRVEAHGSYSYDDIARISAFGSDVSLKWFQTCRDNQATETWKLYFTNTVPSIEDCDIEQWARSSILPND
jgi:glycosyltransferase involved in cell wall biosynthesis